ncbi:MAG TPA: YciI family protein [Vicinamibacterales bacterium]
MSQFMLLLYNSNPDRFRELGPEEMQKAIEKYMAWSKKPFTVASQRLGDDAGKVIRTGGGKPRATDGPYSETKEMLGGYYTIEAANYDEAVARALDHPHLEYGGTIEVRKLFEM